VLPTKPSIKPTIQNQGEDTPKNQNKKFFRDVALQEELVQDLVAAGKPEDFVRREIAKFISYWCELTPSGTKQLWETKPTFEVKRRLATWFGRASEQRLYRPKEKKGIIVR
jgi:hypothetical protein